MCTNSLVLLLLSLQLAQCESPRVRGSREGEGSPSSPLMWKGCPWDRHIHSPGQGREAAVPSSAELGTETEHPQHSALNSRMPLSSL